MAKDCQVKKYNCTNKMLTEEDISSLSNLGIDYLGSSSAKKFVEEKFQYKWDCDIPARKIKQSKIDGLSSSQISIKYGIPLLLVDEIVKMDNFTGIYKAKLYHKSEISSKKETKIVASGIKACTPGSELLKLIEQKKLTEKDVPAKQARDILRDKIKPDGDTSTTYPSNETYGLKRSKQAGYYTRESLEWILTAIDNKRIVPSHKVPGYTDLSKFKRGFVTAEAKKRGIIVEQIMYCNVFMSTTMEELESIVKDVAKG